jgi:hypothetical protein
VHAREGTCKPRATFAGCRLSPQCHCPGFSFPTCAEPAKPPLTELDENVRKRVCAEQEAALPPHKHLRSL